MTAPLLTIDNLKVAFSTRNGRVEALKGVSLSLDAGETLGIVGESGSGKSVTAFSVMQLLDRAGKITEGRIAFRYVVDNVSTAGNYLGLDDVVITSAIPEPATYLLMGLGVAGLMLRRRFSA